MTSLNIIIARKAELCCNFTRLLHFHLGLVATCIFRGGDSPDACLGQGPPIGLASVSALALATVLNVGLIQILYSVHIRQRTESIVRVCVFVFAWFSPSVAVKKVLRHATLLGWLRIGISSVNASNRSCLNFSEYLNV